MKTTPLQPARLAVALALALGTTSVAANGHTSSAPNATELPAVEVVGQKPQRYLPPRVSATKSGAALKDTPQSITVISEGLIQDQAMRDMADVVRYVPGVGMAQGEGNRDTPIFRGNGSTADLFIDGMRDDVQYFRDLYNIEQAEVLKGPNAMLFGRGGSGGLLNRVSKQAGWNAKRAGNLQLGSWNKRRATVDIGEGFNEQVAGRVTALVERNESFRNGYEAERWGINPTLAVRANASTLLGFGVERFHDERVADRGIPSFHGKPLATDASTFFGDPARSPTWADVEAFNSSVEYSAGKTLTLVNRTRLADYDKFYQNVFPGAVNTAGTQVSISAYNHLSHRRNLFNQTDVTLRLQSGKWRHTLLFGAELGRQESDNLRNTGYFTAIGTNTTSVAVPLTNPVYTGPVQFRLAASDANNHSVAKVAALYVQDQIEFSPKWQAILGLRIDDFDTVLDNRRNGTRLQANDRLASPRAGLIYQPVETVSLYASYSNAFLPRAGEQLASLTTTTAALDPEEFENHELGLKWDLRDNLNLTAAVYRLDRSNVAVVDPTRPGQLMLLSGPAQRVRGIELGLGGQVTERWSVMGGMAWQKAEILRDIRTSPTSVLPAGTVLAQVPERSASLWNRYDFSAEWGVGLGAIHRSEVYASTTNAVTLPAYTRFDAALYWTLNPQISLQLNVENLGDRDYYVSAHNDNNISPGSPRAFTLGMNLSF